MNVLSIVSIGYLLVAILIYFNVPKKFQVHVLLFVSIFFYVQNSYINILFLLLTSLSVYYGALLISKVHSNFEEKLNIVSGAKKKALRLQRDNKKKLFVAVIIFLNISSLFYFKYVNAVLKVLDNLFTGIEVQPLELLLPLGISFYTFQAIGYLIDVYRGQIDYEKKYYKLLLFLSYFPQVIQGPIGRYTDLMPQLDSEHRFNYDETISALILILWGYFKKLIIAEGLANIANPILGSPQEFKGFYIFIGIFLYSIQIYADFSGGIDIISGISEIFGIKLARNFRRPFFATSLSDFWRRWHITLGSWMKDYVFYPVAFSPRIVKFNKWLKKSKNKKYSKILPSAVASMVVFFFVGIWHGSSFKYVAFGLYNGIIITSSLLLEDRYASWKNKIGIDDDSFEWKVFQILRTLLIITIGRYFTRATSFKNAITLLRSTFVLFNPYILFDGSFSSLGLSESKLGIVAIAILVLFTVEIIQEYNIDIRGHLMKSNFIFRMNIMIFLVISIVLFGFYGDAVDTANFIYQGF